MNILATIKEEIKVISAVLFLLSLLPLRLLQGVYILLVDLEHEVVVCYCAWNSLDTDLKFCKRGKIEYFKHSLFYRSVHISVKYSKLSDP